MDKEKHITTEVTEGKEKIFVLEAVS